MRAFALSDGAAGNAKQALALADLLGQAATGLTVQLSGADRLLAPRFKAASLRGTQIGDASVLTALATWIERSQPELVIGCGRAAAAVLRTIKQTKESCKTIQILAPECGARHFDWVVCPQHDRLRAPNVLTSLGSIHNIESQLTAHCNQSDALLLLIGQPNKNARWTEHQLRTLLADLQQWPGELCISTSRRSGFDINALIAASKLAEHPRVKIYQAGTATPNPYLAWLLCAGTIIVTPDSVNMISEAMATRARLLVPWQASARGKIARFLQINQPRLNGFDVRDIGAERSPAVPHADCEALAKLLKRNLGLC